MVPNLFARNRGMVVSLVGASLLMLAGIGAICVHRVHGTTAVRAAQTAARYADSRRAQAQLAAMPLSFEPNLGQTDAQVKYLARGAQYEVFLTSDAAVFAVSNLTGARSTHKGGPVTGIKSAAVRLAIVGANTEARVSPRELGEGVSNYAIGRDSQRWLKNVPQYARVNYAEIYPGIDLTYYGREGQLEFDFVVAPGAAVEKIALGVTGADEIKTDPAGNLVLASAAGDVLLHKPVAYQKKGDRREPVEAAFVVNAANEVAFALGPYDRTRELVIDPSVTYSTYLGAGNTDLGFGIAVDGAGSAYIAGQTLSAGFPKTIGSFTGKSEAFVTKFKPDGSGLVYSTLIGGTGDQSANAIAIDASKNAYIVGGTSSDETSFPLSADAAQSIYGGGTFDAFITRLDANGNISYSSFAGGELEDIGLAVAVDGNGNIYAGGETTSTLFPVFNPLQSSNAGDHDGFIVKIDHSTGGMDFSTYLGGEAADQITSIAVDGSSNIYVTGITVSKLFPVTSGAYQTQCGTDGNCNPASTGAQPDAFVTAIKSDFSAAIYSTYFGGSGVDEGQALAVDSSGDAFIAGDTSSTDLKTVNPYQSSLTSGAASNGFVAELAPTGQTAKYVTYIGGGGQDAALGLALDGTAQNIYLTGQTNSSNFPVVNALQPALGGGTDAFISQLKPSAGSGSAQLLFSTYLGGSSNENVNSSAQAGAIAVDGQGNIYVTGFTQSTQFPVVNPFQATLSSPPDVFVTKVSPAASNASIAIADFTLSPTAISRGGTATATVTVTSQNGFAGSVNLNCTIGFTGSPAQLPTCSLKPTSVLLAANGNQQSTITITTKAPAGTSTVPTGMWLPVSGLAMIGMVFAGRRPGRKALGTVALLCALGLFLASAGCGSSGGSGGGGGGGGTSTGSYTVTVTGAALGVPTATTHASDFTVQ